MLPISISLLTQEPLGIAYDYYVDSVNGNDSNNGLSLNSAFKTITKLMTKSLGGKRIGLVKGSTWTEELDITEDNVTIEAVGSGNDPTFNCTDAVAGGAWSKTGGYTNIYQFTGATNYIPSRPVFNSIWEDGTRLPHAASLAALDAAPGSYFVATHTTATPVIYVHATGSGNPASNGKAYIYPTRSCGVDSYETTGTSITGIKVQKNLCTDGGLRMGLSSLVENCTVEDGNKHNFLGRAGTNWIGCTANGSYYTSSTSAFVLNENSPNGQTSLFRNCTVTMPSYLSYANGFYGHMNVSGNFGTITFENCSVSNVVTAYSFSSTALVKYINCSATNCRYDFTTGSAGMTCEITGGTFSSNVASSGCLNDVSFATTWKFDGSTISRTDCQNGLMYSNKASSLRIENCHLTTTKNAAAAQNHVNMSNAGASYYARYNHHTSPNLADGPYMYVIATGATLNSDYNQFARANFWFNIAGTNYSTVALYQAGKGQDAHSTIG